MCHCKRLLKKFSIKTSYLVEKQLSFVIRKEIKLTDGISEDHTFQYVSILRLIEVLLLKKDVQKYVFSSGVTESDELICEFKVGLIFKNNTTRTSSNKTLYIMLYCDGFVFATPLGNKVKQCKISAFYVVLKQLTKKKGLMLSSTNLAVLCKTIFIEKYCYELVLAPLIKDLNILEQKGVFSNID